MGGRGEGGFESAKRVCDRCGSSASRHVNVIALLNWETVPETAPRTPARPVSSVPTGAACESRNRPFFCEYKLVVARRVKKVKGVGGG